MVSANYNSGFVTYLGPKELFEDVFSRSISSNKVPVVLEDLKQYQDVHTVTINDRTIAFIEKIGTLFAKFLVFEPFSYLVVYEKDDLEHRVADTIALFIFSNEADAIRFKIFWP